MLPLLALAKIIEHDKIKQKQNQAISFSKLSFDEVIISSHNLQGPSFPRFSNTFVSIESRVDGFKQVGD